MRHRLSRLARPTILAGLTLAAVGLAAAARPPIERPESPAAELRSMLNTLLQEHVYLALSATGAALGGRNNEFTAAAGALDANSVALSQAIGSVYGNAAGTSFLSLWRTHIGLLVEYTKGVAAKDVKRQEAAVTGLVKYADDFGAFIASANPHLPKAAVAELVRSHILGLKDVVDAQARKDDAKAYAAARTAASHMSMIGTPLADAIVKQFPDRFPAR
jgi:hypothetical protein